MFNFKGCTCEICSKNLKESDDIVVCPYCGTPYHRECYAQAGKCLHEAEHKKGYEFKAFPIMHDDCTAPVSEEMKCVKCGVVNKSSNIFCQSCGQPLHATPPQFPSNQSDEMLTEMPFLTGLPPIGKDDEIDGIAVRDWMEYTGASGPYYIYQFKSMDIARKKTSICWSAVFFPYFYFFFRKMWLWGLLAGVVTLLCNVPTFMIMMLNAGILPFDVSSTVLANINLVTRIIMMTMNVLFGIYAIYLYRKSAGAVIKKKRASISNPDNYRSWLQKASGPSKAGLIVAVAVLIAVSYALILLIGPQNIANMTMLIA